MKRTVKILGLSAGVIAIFVAVGLFSLLQNPKSRIIRQWEKDVEVYRSTAEAILLSGGDTPVSLDSISDVRLWNSVQVDFTCQTKGFGASTDYYGFYYSADDLPRGFQGSTLTFTPYQDGLRWEEPGGDNSCYLEKLAQNWYYFEMHF